MDHWIVHRQTRGRIGREMKFINEFRNAGLARAVAAEIEAIAPRDKRYKIMEICGGHTHTIYRHGIKDLLPDRVEMIHGPGCPVCVLPMGRVDDGIAIAERPEVILTCFGDMMRVPGSKGTLLEVKARGADVRMVYSPLDALRLARENPAREVVFYAIGFETTAPSTALTLMRAKKEGVKNFTVFCNHVTIVPPLRALLESPELKLDGFIGPGHVSTVVGCKLYQFICTEYGKPIVVAGFEPLDLIQSILMVVRQLTQGRCEVENQYTRSVPWEGNLQALKCMDKVFEVRPYFEWRGLGFIAQSALKLSREYAEFDSEIRFDTPSVRVADPTSCQCGEVLKGVLKPRQCRVFGTRCTPEHPLGALMVSSEGACAAYFNFGRKVTDREMDRMTDREKVGV